jgi:hypothetical protein
MIEFLLFAWLILYVCACFSLASSLDNHAKWRVSIEFCVVIICLTLIEILKG